MTGTAVPGAFLALALASWLPLAAGCFENETRGPQDTGVPDTGPPDADPSCMPRAETCNGLDDDCDGVGDTDDPGAQADCDRVVANATSFCAEVADTWRCVPGACNEGFAHCDGDPSNGCEPRCQCDDCPDAAM